ncbi:RIP metalloprotease RseP [Arenimonas caeni]|jgi:regulator of sigma E protease|uniref:Zinc metalloprotease n=1 Tax=Arenimonas caeni TaxID=2058085 RepID=A0A2P6M9U1_9GAMM|nr:RIP metalloprotease RseP [Arenimonas caeni]MDY0021502.1 RIP metalloprotease RseP [Arenimonas caeni]PRH82745.1 RIP metalloprotease RseP [Arenimonas caeni]
MNEFFGSVWWLIVSLGLLVTFHEFGHYWVARRCGVRVLRFSVGFGKPLWKRLGKDGTEYVVAWIPLGGYVKMLDEREVEVAPHERHESFNAKTVWQRIAIVAAGPLANLVLCVGLLWLMFVVGKPDFQPDIGSAEGVAAEAGFAPGDRLVDIDGRQVRTWTEAGIALTKAVIDREPTPVRVRDASGAEVVRVLPLDRPGLALDEEQPFTSIGLRPVWPPVVGEVAPGSAAEGRLRSGDRIVSIAGRPVHSFDRIGPLLQELAGPGRELTIAIERDGRLQSVAVEPRQVERDGRPAWQLGIGAAPVEQDALLRFNPLQALPAALSETRQMTSDVVGMLWRMVTGEASLKNISGPITIARVANGSASLGPAWFLNFLAVLSLSLFIMNLLPIPVLDGGHLLYYLIELVKGSPVGERGLVAGQYIGLALLAGLMGLAFYNDILRLGS